MKLAGKRRRTFSPAAPWDSENTFSHKVSLYPCVYKYIHPPTPCLPLSFSPQDCSDEITFPYGEYYSSMPYVLSPYHPLERMTMCVSVCWGCHVWVYVVVQEAKSGHMACEPYIRIEGAGGGRMWLCWTHRWISSESTNSFISTSDSVLTNHSCPPIIVFYTFTN